jgi:hypothetical protein
MEVQPCSLVCRQLWLESGRQRLVDVYVMCKSHRKASNNVCLRVRHVKFKSQDAFGLAPPVVELETAVKHQVSREWELDKS